MSTLWFVQLIDLRPLFTSIIPYITAYTVQISSPVPTFFNKNNQNETYYNSYFFINIHYFLHTICFPFRSSFLNLSLWFPIFISHEILNPRFPVNLARRANSFFYDRHMNRNKLEKRQRGKEKKVSDFFFFLREQFSFGLNQKWLLYLWG